ncbi:hypothetical protein V2J09_016493 [Rumex salicifolius]
MSRRSRSDGRKLRCQYHGHGKSSEFTSTIKEKSSSQGKRQGGVASAGAAIGGPFSLVNTENQVFTDQDFGGKWVLLYFGYTSSPETGPTEVQKLAKTVDILGSIINLSFGLQHESKHKIKVLPVFVSIDPKRNLTPQLKAYLAYLSEFDRRIVGLTGTNATVRHMASQYRVFFMKVDEDGDDYLVEFLHNLYLINPDKDIVRSFRVESSAEERSEEILKEIYRKSEEDV